MKTMIERLKFLEEEILSIYSEVGLDGDSVIMISTEKPINHFTDGIEDELGKPDSYKGEQLNIDIYDSNEELADRISIKNKFVMITIKCDTDKLKTKRIRDFSDVTRNFMDKYPITLPPHFYKRTDVSTELGIVMNHEEPYIIASDEVIKRLMKEIPFHNTDPIELASRDTDSRGLTYLLASKLAQEKANIEEASDYARLIVVDNDKFVSSKTIDSLFKDAKSNVVVIGDPALGKSMTVKDLIVTETIQDSPYTKQVKEQLSKGEPIFKMDDYIPIVNDHQNKSKFMSAPNKHKRRRR